MATLKNRRCKRCQGPCSRTYCRPCSRIALPSPQKRAARNPSWGSGATGLFIATRPEATRSWWITPTREAFQAAHQQELPRLAQTTTSVPPVNIVE